MKAHFYLERSSLLIEQSPRVKVSAPTGSVVGKFYAAGLSSSGQRFRAKLRLPLAAARTAKRTKTPRESTPRPCGDALVRALPAPCEAG